MASPINPYLPDKGEQLAMLLMSLGSGFSSAGAAGRPAWEGLSPAASAMGAGMGQARQQAMEYDRFEKQYGEQAAYRQAQEKKLAAETAAIEQEQKRDAGLEPVMREVYRRMGFGVDAPGPTPGFAPAPRQPTMGPGGAPPLPAITPPKRTASAEPTEPGGGSFDDPTRMAAGMKSFAAFAQANPNLSIAEAVRQWAPGNAETHLNPVVESLGVHAFTPLAELAKDPDAVATALSSLPAGFAEATFMRPTGAPAPGATPPVQRAQYVPPQGVQPPSGTGIGGPPGAAPPYATPTPPGIDPKTGLPFLQSKRYAPFGKAIIDLGTSEMDRDLKQRELLRQIDQDQGKAQEFDRTQGGVERNQPVGPDGKPNRALLDVEAEKERLKREADLDTTAATTLVQSAVKDFVDKERPKGVAIQETIPQLHNIRRQIEAGAITGTGAEMRNALLQAAVTFGLSKDTAASMETPALFSAMARQLTANAKALGVNPTNRDAEITKVAEGANPAVSKEALLKLLDVNENIHRQAHDRYLAEADRVLKLRGVKAAYGDEYFKLPAPPKYDEWKAAHPLPGAKQGGPVKIDIQGRRIQ